MPSDKLRLLSDWLNTSTVTWSLDTSVMSCEVVKIWLQAQQEYRHHSHSDYVYRRLFRARLFGTCGGMLSVPIQRILSRDTHG